MLTLAPDDLALFLAAHGTKEGWRHLSWLCDFAEFMRKHPDIDWLSLLGRAQRLGCSRSLLLAVALATTLLDAPAPALLIHAARKNSAVRALEDKAKSRMERSASEEKITIFRDRLATHDRLRDRIWPVSILIFTRTVGDYRIIPLPKPLWALYYLIRPFRLLLKAAELLAGTKKARR